MYNRVVLVGRFTRDVEMRYTPSGHTIGKVGIASSHFYKRQDGSKVEEVCFVDVDLFGRTAEIANQYLRKGSKVLIEGRLKLDSWVDQSGVKKSKHSIVADNLVMLDSKSEGDFSPRTESGFKKEAPEKIREIDVDADIKGVKRTGTEKIDLNNEEMPF